MKICLWIIFLICFFSCDRADEKNTDKQKESRTKGDEIQNVHSEHQIVDTLYKYERLNISLIDDSIVCITRHFKDQFSSVKMIVYGLKENIDLIHKGIIFFRNDGEISKTNFYALTDSLFIFSVFDFKYRTKIYGFDIVDGQIQI